MGGPEPFDVEEGFDNPGGGREFEEEEGFDDGMEENDGAMG